MVSVHLPELDPRAHDEVDGPRGHKEEDVADDVARWNEIGTDHVMELSLTMMTPLDLEQSTG